MGSSESLGTHTCTQLINQRHCLVCTPIHSARPFLFFISAQPNNSTFIPSLIHLCDPPNRSHSTDCSYCTSRHHHHLITHAYEDSQNLTSPTMASFMSMQYDSDSDSVDDLDFEPASDGSSGTGSGKGVCLSVRVLVI